MWNLCSASKLVSDREKQRSYELHQQKLTKMRPKIKIVAPSQPQFVYAKHKLQMSRRDRLIEIDYQNDILLRKMKKISQEEYRTNKLRPEAQQLKTLNQHIVNQQAEDIYNENRRICEKLMKVGSYYPTLEIIDKTDQLERVRFNISENARRVKSVAQLRPQSSLSYRSKFYRSKVSKFDHDGNGSQERLYKYFHTDSQPTLRPESAPSKPKSSRQPQSREYSSHHPRVAKNETPLNAEQQGVFWRQKEVVGDSERPETAGVSYRVERLSQPQQEQMVND